MGRLTKRPVQFWLLSKWKIATGSLQDSLEVNYLLIHHLEWWCQNQNLRQGIPIFRRQGDLVLVLGCFQAGSGRSDSQPVSSKKMVTIRTQTLHQPSGDASPLRCAETLQEEGLRTTNNLLRGQF